MKAAVAKRKSGSRPIVAAGNSQATHELVRKVQAGLPFRELEKLRQQLALPLDQLSEKLGISRATLHRRKLSGRLTPDESGKVLRFAQLFRLAEEVLGGADEARQWLSYPQYGLGRVVPLDFARTEIGAREVETLLGRIEYGVYT